MSQLQATNNKDMSTSREVNTSKVNIICLIFKKVMDVSWLVLVRTHYSLKIAIYIHLTSF